MEGGVMSHNPSLYSSLVAVADESIAKLDAHAVAGKFVQGTIGRATYVRYLRRVARQVRGTSPMFWEAGARLWDRGRDELATLFSRKGGQVAGHHVWAENDLVALGEQPAANDEIPFAAVDAYGAYARYCAEVEPVSVLGIAWTLECIGAARAGAAADALVARSQIPNIASAVTFLRRQGEADTSRLDALRHALIEVTSPDDVDGIVLAARFTGRVYLGFFDDGFPGEGDQTR
jgi:hypothetical protein